MQNINPLWKQEIEEYPAMPDFLKRILIDETPEDVTRDSNTHEYECTNCGYVLFPAAGREFKFFGADFTCPGCGAGKDSFVDNGPVE